MSELDDLHNQLRRADFDLELRDRVLALDKPWRSLRTQDVPAYIKGRCVVAETCDYFGLYDKANEALVDVTEPLLERELAKAKSAATETDRRLVKRWIWLAIAKVQVEYRSERYDDTQDYLVPARAALSAMDPLEQDFFGTRARLTYFEGQILRQQGIYDKAREKFDQTIIFARKRFQKATPFAQLTGPLAKVGKFSPAEEAIFSQSHLLASWSIGKAQALGLGWIDYTTGRLASASMLLSAGYSLLRGTGDGLHRAYATLLLGVVERAAARDTEQRRIQAAIAVMKRAKGGLRGHPFYPRACYELALAHLRVDEFKEAREELKEMVPPPGQRGRNQELRWQCNRLIVESRIARASADWKDAMRAAIEAGTIADQIAKKSKSPKRPAIWVESRIARAEALLAVEQSHSEPARRDERLYEAVTLLRDALQSGGANPKTSAVCHLHLARAERMRGQHAEARAHYQEWPSHLHKLVEQGFIKDLARDVAAELDWGGGFFITSSLELAEAEGCKKGKWKCLRANLDQYLIKRALDLHGGDDVLAMKELGIDRKTFDYWKAKFELSRKPGRPRRRSRVRRQKHK